MNLLLCVFASVMLTGAGCADRGKVSRNELYRGAVLEERGGHLYVTAGEGNVLALTRGRSHGRWTTAHGQWHTILLALPDDFQFTLGTSHTFDRNAAHYRGYSRAQGWEIMPEKEIEIRLEVLKVTDSAVVARVNGSVPLQAYRRTESDNGPEAEAWLPRYNTLHFSGKYRFVETPPEDPPEEPGAGG
jgi:hypothetical protein